MIKLQKLSPKNLENMRKHVSGGYSVVIISWDAWKRIWVGCDLTQSKMVVAKVVATTGIAAWAPKLIA